MDGEKPSRWRMNPEMRENVRAAAKLAVVVGIVGILVGEGAGAEPVTDFFALVGLLGGLGIIGSWFVPDER